MRRAPTPHNEFGVQMYSITVTEVGETVPALLEEKMLVLFGPTVPTELKDICVVHDGAPTEEDILAPGGTITIAGKEYRIVVFGDAANVNMGGLGHLTIVFGGEGEVLPGSVRVTPEELPQVSAGDVISFS